MSCYDVKTGEVYLTKNIQKNNKITLTVICLGGFSSWKWKFFAVRNWKTKRDQIIFISSRDERACLICLINIHGVSYDVIVALLILKLYKIANNFQFNLSNILID